MATIENSLLPNRHTLYLAQTGHGKSQCVKRMSGIPGQGARVVLWDTNRDHHAPFHFKNRTAFTRALIEAVRSGRGFRVAWAGERGPAAFEWWCRNVWAILRGDLLTYLVVEEYGRCCASPGNIDPQRYLHHSLLVNESRKYGGIIQATSQRPQGISKELLENSDTIWAGNCGKLARKRLGEEMDIEPGRLARLQVGEFIHWHRGRGGEQVKVFTPHSEKPTDRQPKANQIATENLRLIA